jgi:hypothetical protein
MTAIFKVLVTGEIPHLPAQSRSYIGVVEPRAAAMPS